MEEWRERLLRYLCPQRSCYVCTNPSTPFDRCAQFLEPFSWESPWCFHVIETCSYSNCQLASILKTIPSWWLLWFFAGRPAQWGKRKDSTVSDTFLQPEQLQRALAAPEGRSEDGIECGDSARSLLPCHRPRWSLRNSQCPCTPLRTSHALLTGSDPFHQVTDLPAGTIRSNKNINYNAHQSGFSSMPVCTTMCPFFHSLCVIAHDSS